MPTPCDVKVRQHDGVQLTIFGAPRRVIRIVCHPRRSGVASIHANLLPVLRLLLLYVLRRRVFWRREARQLRTAI